MKELLSSTRFVSLALVGGLAMTTLGAVTARADSTDELLELLRRKGAINKREFSVIKARHAAEKASGGGYIRGGAGGPPARYVTALDRGVGIRIPGEAIPYVKGGPTGTVGDVDISISGNVNAFYVEQYGKVKAPISGGVNNITNKNSAAVQDGLLPTAVILDIATKQGGYDISGTIGFYTGINGVNVAATPFNAQSSGTPATPSTPAIDVKLAYLKVGTNGYGTFEAGRDFNLFAQDILTFDFNELALGNPVNAATPNNSANGAYGSGYIVGGFAPQLRYTTPSYNGFTISVAVEQPDDVIPGPLGACNSSAIAFCSGTDKHSTPQVAGRLKYEGKIFANAKFTGWLGGVTEDLQGLRASEIGFGTFKNSFQAYGGEAGGKLEVGNFQALGYGYYGKGIGTTALYLGGVDLAGHGRESYGYLAQAGYTFFDRLTISGGYGTSYLHRTQADILDAAVGLTNANEKQATEVTGTARYAVTKWLALVAQYSHIRSKALNTERIDTDNYIGGAQIFF